MRAIDPKDSATPAAPPASAFFDRGVGYASNRRFLIRVRAVDIAGKRAARREGTVFRIRRSGCLQTGTHV
jgi:hypothetical protein